MEVMWIIPKNHPLYSAFAPDSCEALRLELNTLYSENSQLPLTRKSKVLQYYEENHPAHARMLPFETLDPETKTAFRNTLHFQMWNVGESASEAAKPIAEMMGKIFKPLR